MRKGNAFTSVDFKILLFTGLMLGPGATASAQMCPVGQIPPPDEEITTYSVLGYDPETGDVGIAIASRVFNVRSFYGKAGVGVVTLQHSFSGENLLTAVEGVELLEMGFEPAEAIRMLMSKDAGRDWRQIGMVDARGNVMAFTGPDCTYWAGDRQGTYNTAQGNMLTGKETVDAMVSTFESTEGELADRLMAALLKADSVGGDARGKQSAALRVYREPGPEVRGGDLQGLNGEPMDHHVDLRVMDHEEPVREMARLWQTRKDFQLLGIARRAFNAGEVGRGMEIAKEFIRRRPEETSGYETLALMFYQTGEKDQAIEWFREAEARTPRFEELFRMRINVIGDRAGSRGQYSIFEDDPEFLRRLFGR